jgi:glutaminyl-tRNA synthetase
VSATENVPFEARLYDTLFTKEDPNDFEEGGSFLDNLNPDSLQVVTAYAEPALSDAVVGEQFQFERKGYFCIDPDSKPGALVVNRSVGLRDSWGKQQGK